MGIVNSTPFRMRKVIMIISKKVAAAADVPARDGRDRGAAAARRDGSVDDRACADAGEGRCGASASSTFRWDRDITSWTPPGESGALTDLSVTLSPLEPVKKHITVLSNMELKNAYPGTHATSNAAFLSAAKAKWTESSDYYLGTTVDQIAAQQMGQETQLPSLELAMDLMEVVGQCDNGYACVYQNNLSWSSPTTPLPSEAHPRVVFERLFGEGGSSADRRKALGRRASLLDWVREDIARLQRPARRRAIGRRSTEYLDTVREVERRIQKAEAQTLDNPLPDLDRPVGVPAVVRRSRQADVRSAGARAAGRHHARHHVPARARNEQPQLSRNRRRRSASSDVAPRRRSGKDREDRQDQPVPRLAVRVLPREAERGVGRQRHAARQFARISTAAAWAIRTFTTTWTCRSSSRAARRARSRGGRHIKYAEPAPLANLHLTLLDAVGVRLDSFQDSTGKIDTLYSPVGLAG